MLSDTCTDRIGHPRDDYSAVDQQLPDTAWTEVPYAHSGGGENASRTRMDERFGAYLQGFGVGLVFAGILSLWLGAIASIATLSVGAVVIVGGYLYKYL
ncbi:MAG: hypothetical protein ABEI76_05605 [Halobacteriales archaeon]